MIGLKVKLVFFLDSLNKKERKPVPLGINKSGMSEKHPGVKSFTSVSITVAKVAWYTENQFVNTSRDLPSQSFDAWSPPLALGEGLHYNFVVAVPIVVSDAQEIDAVAEAFQFYQLTAVLLLGQFYNPARNVVQ